MQEKEINLNGKIVKIREIKFIDMSLIDIKNKEESIRKTLELGSNLTKEDVDNLSVKDGIEITKAINELNGFVEPEVFQKL